MKNILTSLVITSLAVAGDWNQSLDFGLSVNQGNSESTLLNIAYKADKAWESKEFSSANYFNSGSADGTTTMSQLLGNADLKLQHDGFYSKSRLDYLHDDVADIGYRAILTESIGKDWLSNETTTYSNEAGLGYTSENVSSKKDQFVNLYAGHKFEHKLSETGSLFHDLSFFAPVADMDEFFTIANLGAKSMLSDSLSLSVSLQSRFENEVTVGREKHDLLFVSGISYSF